MLGFAGEVALDAHIALLQAHCYEVAACKTTTPNAK